MKALEMKISTIAFIGVVLAGCKQGVSISSTDGSFTVPVEGIALKAAADDLRILELYECKDKGKKGKVLVCHVPPGNPDARHNICIGPKAVQKHLDHHHGEDSDGVQYSDYLGDCDAYIPPVDDGNDDGTGNDDVVGDGSNDGPVDVVDDGTAGDGSPTDDGSTGDGSPADDGSSDDGTTDDGSTGDGLGEGDVIHDDNYDFSEA